MLMLWDQAVGGQPVELARDPNASGPPALAFVMDGSQVVYRVSAGGTQQSDSLVWEDLISRRTQTIYAAPAQTTIFPRALQDNYLVWAVNKTILAQDGSPRTVTAQLLYTKLADGTPAQPQSLALPDSHLYYGAVLDGDVLYWERDDGVVRIDHWRGASGMQPIWQRGPAAGSLFVGSGGVLAWTDSTDGRLLIFDTATESLLVDSSSWTGSPVAVKGKLVWESSPRSSDPGAPGPRMLSWINVSPR